MKKLLLLTLSLFLLVSCSGPSHDETFKTISDASELISQGWVPSNLPSDTTDIMVAYDLDTNICNGKFTLPKGEIESFVSGLSHTDYDTLLAKEYINASFWNDEKIKKSIDNSDLIAGEKDDFLYAVSLSGDVFYWTK